VFFNFSVLTVLCLYFLSQLHNIALAELLAVPAGLLVGNIAVYTIHRFPLHHRYKLIGNFTFRNHAQWHHQFYTNEMIVYDSPKDFYILFFPPGVVLGFTFVFLPICYYLMKDILSTNTVFLTLFMYALYFILYEVFHYVSHLPETHWALHFFPFRHMRTHHLLHHTPALMAKYNFNIVFPLCDYLCGTVYKEDRT
jgi:hypothetical protein